MFQFCWTNRIRSLRPDINETDWTSLRCAFIKVSTDDCVPGCWSQVPTFICYSPPPLTQNASKGLSKQFSGTCTIIQIKYVCQNCVNCPSIRTDLTTRVLGFASYPALGTRDPYLYWGGWHSMATHYLIGIAWYTIDWHANLFAKRLC